MKKNFERKRNKGFTLVELIVVLVILAILAAILIPTLLGFIDRAKDKRKLLNAKSCLTAVQAQFSERYGLNGGTVPVGTPVLYREDTNPQLDYWENKRKFQNGNDDINATRQTDNKAQTNKNDTFATPILKTLESAKDKSSKVKDPFCIICGVGSNAKGTNSQTTKHDKYTVYFLFYMEEKDSTPLFYFDGEWTTTFPKTSSGQEAWDGNNIIREGRLAGKRLQFYSISNEAYRQENGGYSFPGANSQDNKKFWDWMKSFK